MWATHGFGLISSSNFYVPQVNLPGSMASFVMPAAIPAPVVVPTKGLGQALYMQRPTPTPAVSNPVNWQNPFGTYPGQGEAIAAEAGANQQAYSVVTTSPQATYSSTVIPTTTGVIPATAGSTIAAGAGSMLPLLIGGGIVLWMLMGKK
jgi:hypothetical protein